VIPSDTETHGPYSWHNDQPLPDDGSNPNYRTVKVFIGLFDLPAGGGATAVVVRSWPPFSSASAAASSSSSSSSASAASSSWRCRHLSVRPDGCFCCSVVI
jgi:hypothetical protein